MSCVLGINGNFGRGAHDPAAVLIKDGGVVAMVEEERFVRHRRAPGQMPLHAVRWALQHAGITMRDVEHVAFPQAKLEERFDGRLQRWLEYSFGHCPRVTRLDHHLCHAASAYLLSGFVSALVLTIDTSGDGVSSGIFEGRDARLVARRTYPFPNSLGLFYSVITQFLGFRANADESKVMALAALGEPTVDLEFLLESGEMKLNGDMLSETALLPYPEFWTTQEPLFGPRLRRVLGEPRGYAEPIRQHHADLAASAQRHLVHAVELMLLDAAGRYPLDICLAGGVALNCAMNGALERMDGVQRVFVPAVPNDAGTSLGAALLKCQAIGEPLAESPGAYLGPALSPPEVGAELDRLGLNYFDCGEAVIDHAVAALTAGEIVGWFHGPMEVGPRALGNRSVLADPRLAGLHRRINTTVKNREEFLPVAPAVLAENQTDYFESGQPASFMSRAVLVRADRLDLLSEVVHADGSARIQTVDRRDNPTFHALLSAWAHASGVPVLLNTSLNLRGQPIACSVKDALATFFGCSLDRLYVDRFCIRK